MKRCWIILFILTASINCTAQTYKIKKAAAFFTVFIPGMAQSDINGNIINPQPVTERFIYIETNYKSNPKIDSVLYNGIAFSCTIDSVKDKIINVGINAATGIPIVMVPQKGNRIWMISLQQPDGVNLTHTQFKKIVFKCKLGNSSIKQVIANEVKLTAPERY